MSRKFRPGDRVLWRGQEGRVIDVSPSGLHCIELRESRDQIGTVAEYLTAVASPPSIDTFRAKLMADSRRHRPETHNQLTQRHSDWHGSERAATDEPS